MLCLNIVYNNLVSVVRLLFQIKCNSVFKSKRGFFTLEWRATLFLNSGNFFIKSTGNFIWLNLILPIIDYSFKFVFFSLVRSTLFRLQISAIKSKRPSISPILFLISRQICTICSRNSGLLIACQTRGFSCLEGPGAYLAFAWLPTWPVRPCVYIRRKRIKL